MQLMSVRLYLGSLWHKDDRKMILEVAFQFQWQKGEQNPKKPLPKPKQTNKQNQQQQQQQNNTKNPTQQQQQKPQTQKPQTTTTTTTRKKKKRRKEEVLFSSFSA